MPFTFSHPAIILPLAKASKRWFSLTGLIVGSVIPDFEYFLRMRVLSLYSHTLPGLLWFNIPVGIAIAFIFHGIVRNSLINNLPSFLAYRFSSYKGLDWSYYFKQHNLVVVISILNGAGSHLAWDSFTHESGTMVETITVLQRTVLIAGKEVPMFKLLQHGSSLVGALAIIFTVLSLPVLPFKKIGNRWYWIIVAIVTALILTLRVATGLALTQYGNVIVTGISGVMIGLVVASMFKAISFKR